VHLLRLARTRLGAGEVPTLTYSWHSAIYTAVDEPYTKQASWVNIVNWRDAERNLLTMGTGLYVVENAMDESPLYAGESGDIQTRFGGRTSALHELNVRANEVSNVQLRVCGVLSSKYMDPKRISTAEHWLIRALFVREGNDHQLQNIDKTWPLKAPNDGLVIAFKPNGAPDYVKNDIPGYQSLGEGWWGYQYAAGSTVLG
jgi:hypothetical protein